MQMLYNDYGLYWIDLRILWWLLHENMDKKTIEKEKILKNYSMSAL